MDELLTPEILLHAYQMGIFPMADQHGLVNWYKGFRERPPVMLVHGETRAQEALRERLAREAAADVGIATPGQTIDLAKRLKVAA